jgi:hypothetical protein
MQRFRFASLVGARGLGPQRSGTVGATEGDYASPGNSAFDAAAVVSLFALLAFLSLSLLRWSVE